MKMQSSADSLSAMGEGSLLDFAIAKDMPQGVSKFSGAPMGVEGLPSLQELPQVAKLQEPSGTGPNSTPLSSQAQASAGDGGQPYFLDIFCGTAGVTAALKRYGAEAIGIDHVIDKDERTGS